MRAKKSYGQHFLRHPDIARRIADAMEAEGLEGRVLEVGPGKGILTQFVAERWPDFRAVDADADMIAFLNREKPEWQGHLLLADFLRLDLEELYGGRPFGIIGNFPYNISSQILFRMLEYRQLVPELVGMFQREVARRVVSGPGTKDYGILSVLVQTWYEGRYLFSVSRESFDPPPQVQSGVIRLVRRPDADLGCREADLIRLVKAAFNQRRKMLRNTLRDLAPDPAMLEEPLFTRRPEDLAPEEFVALACRFFPAAG
jgi:16S rRNA (adenine1518-N6/adenine1519-N6)-dimethyltransferase